MATGGEWRENGQVYSNNKMSPNRLSMPFGKVYNHTM